MLKWIHYVRPENPPGNHVPGGSQKDEPIVKAIKNGLVKGHQHHKNVQWCSCLQTRAVCRYSHYRTRLTDSSGDDGTSEQWKPGSSACSWKTSECDYSNKQQGQWRNQGGLTFRQLLRWFKECSIPRGKIAGQPTGHCLACPTRGNWEGRSEVWTQLPQQNITIPCPISGPDPVFGSRIHWLKR